MNNKTITRIKNKILNELNSRHISIYELAKRSNISDACIRNWYSKRNYEPSLSSICQVCEVLGISLSQLFVDNDENLFPITEEEKHLLELWSKLNNEEKDTVLTVIKTFITKDK